MIALLQVIGCASTPSIEGTEASSSAIADHPTAAPRPGEVWAVAHDDLVEWGVVPMTPTCIRHLDGSVVATRLDGPELWSVVGRDASTGELLWTTTVDWDPAETGWNGVRLFADPTGILQTGDRIFASPSWFHPVVLDEETGELLGEFPEGLWAAVTSEIAVWTDGYSSSSAFAVSNLSSAWSEADFPGAVAAGPGDESGLVGVDGGVLDLATGWGDASWTGFWGGCDYGLRLTTEWRGPYSTPLRAVACNDTHQIWRNDARGGELRLLATVPDLFVAPTAMMNQPAVGDEDVFALVGPDATGAISVCDFADPGGGRRWCSVLPLPEAATAGDLEDVVLYLSGDLVLGWASLFPEAPRDWLFAFSADTGGLHWVWEDETGGTNYACVPEPLGPNGYLYVIEESRLVAIDPLHVAP